MVERSDSLQYESRKEWKQRDTYPRKISYMKTFSKHIGLIVVTHILINPRLWAHCARPEPTQQISLSLIPHCFSSPFTPCTVDVLLSSPALILPRAEHSCHCSNTASRIPALVKVLPSLSLSFAFLLFTVSLQCSHRWNAEALTPKMMHRLSFLSSRLKNGKTDLRRIWLQHSVEVELHLPNQQLWYLIFLPLF